MTYLFLVRKRVSDIVLKVTLFERNGSKHVLKDVEKIALYFFFLQRLHFDMVLIKVYFSIFIVYNALISNDQPKFERFFLM